MKFPMILYRKAPPPPLQWRSQPKIFGGPKRLTLGEQQYFCLGRRFSKHKMTRFPPGYAYAPLPPLWEVRGQCTRSLASLRLVTWITSP